jgi:hypothetical protein
MRALRFEQTGALADLKVATVGIPAPGQEEVLVKVEAAAINPSDVKNVLGKMAQTTLPRTPGRDFASRVEKEHSCRMRVSANPPCQLRISGVVLGLIPGNFLRQLVLLKPIRSWTLMTLRAKLVKIGAKVVSHAKYVVFQLAEGAVPRPVFVAMVNRIGRLRLTCASG